MKNKIYKITSLLVVSLLLCFVTYKFCYFIAEKYFFDKFFYQKSTTHGYWTKDPKVSYSDFGKRAKDFIALNSKDQKILGASDDNNSYKIVILGDSYLWGQGIKNEDRFAQILENQLNKIRPTKIYSLGICGDNIFDNYLKYKKSFSVFGNSDLYIFALLYNDFLFNNDNRYSSDEFINIFTKDCPENKIYDPNNPSNDEYYHAIKSSLATDSSNYCAYKNLLPLLPKKNAIYINLGSIQKNIDTNDEQFKNIISSDLNVINLLNNNSTNYPVSKAESHPSAAINKIYANTLFNEITTNPKWGFTNE